MGWFLQNFLEIVIFHDFWLPGLFFNHSNFKTQDPKTRQPSFSFP